MKRAACAVLSLWLWGCGPAEFPSPSIVSVMPGRVAQGGSSALSVKVDAVLPLSVDYETGSVDPAQLAIAVQLAGQGVDVPFIEPDGTLIVPVPEGLALGEHDLRVSLADGREVVRERAFSVVLPSTLTGEPVPRNAPADGSPEEQTGMMGFQIDPIGEQIRDVPFRLTLRATGPDAGALQEAVSVRASKGPVVTVSRGTFAEGARVEEISLSHPGSHLYLLVEDAHGNKALSNPFSVRPY